MATVVDSLDLSGAVATKVIKLAKKHDIYSDAIPKTEKDKVAAANDIITFCVDAWVENEVRPDDDDEDSAAAAEQCLEFFELVGIEVDDDDDLVIPDDDNDDDDDDDEDDQWDEESLGDLNTKQIKEVAEEFEVEVPEGKLGSARKRKLIAEILEAQEGDEEDDEAAVDIEDIIEGYDELTPVSKVKAIKKLELDVDDDEDGNTIQTILDHEEAQDKPASRVMNYLEELVGEENEEDEEEEDEEEDSDEPFEGYDGASVADLKTAIAEAIEEENIDADDVGSIVEYEEANRNRKGLVKWLNELLEEDDEDEDEDEEEVAPKKRPGKSAAKSSSKKKEEEEDEVDLDSIVEEISDAIKEILAQYVD